MDSMTFKSPPKQGKHDSNVREFSSNELEKVEEFDNNPTRALVENEESPEFTPFIVPANLKDFEASKTGKSLGKRNKVVIGIDFGSTHSGYSYAFTFGNDQGSIMMPPKKYGVFKEPTCALFTPDGELEAFGYEARTRYLDILTAAKAAFMHDDSYIIKNQLYFDHEKLKMRMYHHSDKHLRSFDNRLVARAANGQEVNLEPLVSAILHHLKGSALRSIRTHFSKRTADGELPFKTSDILWVLTMPAIWLESDKQFMRKCASNAGINTKQLVLALEPEVACLRLGKDWKEGEKVLCLDCGGGTVDISAVQRQQNGRFKLLLEPSGGNWGSTYIDDKFFNFLRKVFGADTLAQAMLATPAQHSIREAWERLKLSLKPEHFSDSLDPKAYATLDLKLLLAETGQDLLKLLKKYNSVHKYKAMAELRRGLIFKSRATKVFLSPGLLRSFFDPVIRKIVAHTGKLLLKRELEHCRTVCLVGGFGACSYLRVQLKRKMDEVCELADTGAEMRLIAPQDASSVVMSGAVQFGLRPELIEIRMAGLSVGLKTVKPLSVGTSVEESGYPADKIRYDARLKCHVVQDVFLPVVRRGQEVSLDFEVRRTFVAKRDQGAVKFDIFASKAKDVQFVTDEFCVRIGKFIIPNVMDETDPSPTNIFICHLKLGFTEIICNVENRSLGTTVEMRMSFDRTGKDAVVVDEATPTA